LRLKPGNAETEFNLALALNRQEQWSEAAGLLEKTAGLHLEDPKAHYELAVALVHLQRTREAMSQYAAALLLKPDYAAALDGLGWILSTAPNPEFRNGHEAVKMAEQACLLTGRTNAPMLKTLAAAYAETSRYPDAITTLQAAKQLPQDGKHRDVDSAMLKAFEQSRPWREQ